MKSARITMSLISLIALGVTACSSSGISRSTLTKTFVLEQKKNGTDVDAGCVSEAFAKLSDADMKVIDVSIRKDAEPVGISGDGMALIIEAMSCAGSIDGVSIPAGVAGLSAAQNLMLTEMLKQMEASGLKVDKDCMTEAVKGLDNNVLTNTSSPEVAAIGAEVLKCVTP
jgi:hypothetical protein